MIRFKQKGDFKKLNNYLEKIKESINIGTLDKYGRLGVEALQRATPKDTGETASSWRYEIVHTKNGVRLQFLNSSQNQGIPIAILLQYGHGTRNGGWVEGTDYINPALKPVFDQLLNSIWEEVKRT